LKRGSCRTFGTSSWVADSAAWGLRSNIKGGYTMVILALNSPSLAGEQRLAPADDLRELINDLAGELARYPLKPQV
jgi:hypothetical protein